MQESDALELGRQAMLLALQLTLPVLTISLTVGVLVSLFQTVTSIQEQTLTFVPKLVVLSLALLVLGPWMLHTVVGFTSGLINSLPTFIH
jgi:flagellar biosynthetic protein FliQ